MADDDDDALLVWFAAYWVVPSNDGVPFVAPTMRINGMFVRPGARRQEIVEELLVIVAREAIARRSSGLAWRNGTPRAALFSANLETRVEATGTEYHLAAETLEQFADGSHDQAAS